MLGLSELKQTRVYQEARQEGLEEGRQEGLEEGLEQGQLRAKLAMVHKLRQRGFGIEELAALLELDIETVRRAAQEQS
jgi:predicted transposase/invertase (TIGR01784 family)